jgi:hypothetical protein
MSATQLKAISVDSQEPSTIQSVHCSRCGNDYTREAPHSRKSSIACKDCDRCRGRCKSCLKDPATNPLFRAGQCNICYYSGKTFAPLQRVYSRGKFRGFHDHDKLGNHMSLDAAKALGWLETPVNGQPSIEEIYSAENVRSAQEIVTGLSVRDIQRKWGVSLRTAHQAKQSILDLPIAEPEASSDAGEAATILEKWKPAAQPSVRKCVHGNWQAADDRRGFSRYCTACAPHEQSVYHTPVQVGPANQELATQWRYFLCKLYESGESIKRITELTGIADKQVRQPLAKAGIMLRPEDRRATNAADDWDAPDI